MPFLSSRPVASLARAYPEVQLATLTATPPTGPEWLHELKFDGYRLLGFLADGQVLLRTRNGNDWTAKFPAIADALRVLPAESVVVDMEAVVLDEFGKSNFSALQQALSPGGTGSSITAFAFDLLHFEGQSYVGLPLQRRKRKLKALLRGPQSTIRYSDHIIGSAARLVAKVCSMGLEGIVSKRIAAPYSSGRQHSWLKSKCVRRQEFIILGYSKPRAGTRALGALYLGYKKGGKLRYAGKCGTGFTMQSAQALVERLRRVDVSSLDRNEALDLPAAEWQAIRWVEASALCEVTFTEWAGEGRIRHPSFQGLREDKAASDVVEEEPWQEHPQST